MSELLAVAPAEDFMAPQTFKVNTMDDVRSLSKMFFLSDMFKADRNLSQEAKMAQAGVKIVAGMEFGIGPFAAMKGINIIGGNAEMSSNLMAGKVKAHPKYDYRVPRWDADGCDIDFYEIVKPGAPITEQDKLGASSFTKEDAQAAELTGNRNYKKFARNMYFARAMSNGVRTYCPDIFYGTPVYTEGEISGSQPVQAEAENTSDAALPEKSGVDSPAGSLSKADAFTQIGTTLQQLGVESQEDRLKILLGLTGAAKLDDVTAEMLTTAIKRLADEDIADIRKRYLSQGAANTEPATPPETDLEQLLQKVRELFRAGSVQTEEDMVQTAATLVGRHNFERLDQLEERELEEMIAALEDMVLKEEQESGRKQGDRVTPLPEGQLDHEALLDRMNNLLTSTGKIEVFSEIKGARTLTNKDFTDDDYKQLDQILQKISSGERTIPAAWAKSSKNK